jgi:hypothetical protein
LRRRHGPSRASKDAKRPRGTYRDPRSPFSSGLARFFIALKS